MSACNDNGTVICARGGLFVCCLVFRGPRGLCGADWAGPGLRCTPCAHEYRVINFCARASHGPSASPVSLLVFQLSSRAEKSLTLRRDAQISLCASNSRRISALPCIYLISRLWERVRPRGVREKER